MPVRKAKQKREELIGVRVTKDEMAELMKAAENAKAHTLTDYVRDAALDRARGK